MQLFDKVVLDYHLNIHLLVARWDRTAFQRYSSSRFAFTVDMQHDVAMDKPSKVRAIPAVLAIKNFLNCFHMNRRMQLMGSPLFRTPSRIFLAVNL